MKGPRFLFAFLRKDFVDETSYRGNLFLYFLGIAVQCLLFYHLAQVVDTADLRYRSAFRSGYFSYFVLGMGIFQFTQTGLASFVQAFRKERAGGTLEMLWLGTPSPLTLVFSIGLWPFVSQFLFFLTFIAVGRAMSPLIFQGLSWGAVGFSLLLAFPLYFSSGLLAVSLTFLTRRGEFWVNLYGSLNLILGGVLFPVSLLPRFLQGVSEWLPLTHLLRLARAEEFGLGREAWFEGMILAAFTAGLLGVGLFFLRAAIRQAEREGSLAHT